MMRYFTGSLIITIVLLIAQGNLLGQQITSLSLGDDMPYLKIKNVLNYPNKELSFSDFKEKAIILDFASTTCTPCVKIFPILDSAQRKLGDKLQIILVTFEKKEIVEKYLKKKNYKVSIPVIYEDSLLSQYFKHLYFPHEVWINNKGIIKAITGHEYVNSENINSLVNNAPLDWAVKWDFPYDYNKPLWMLNASNIPTVAKPGKAYYSSLTTHLEGITHRSNTEEPQFDSLTNTYRTFMINYSILDMYMRALGKYYWDFPPSKIMLLVSDTSKVLYFSKYGYESEWRKKNTYCYESVLPASMSKELRKKKMAEELNEYFGLNGNIETRKVKCWILKKTGNSSLTIKNNKDSLSFSDIIYNLNQRWGNPPVINGTEYSKNELHRLFIPENNLPHDINSINSVLAKYGLILAESERNIEVFVIKEHINDKNELTHR